MPLAFRLARSLLFACCGLFVSADCGTIYSQSAGVSCVVEDIDTPTMPACVLQARNDALYIPKKFWMHPVFNRYGLSPFTILSFGRVYINRSGRVVIRDVAFMDNAPDEFHHGMVRIERDGKWGFADHSGRIIVPMKYSCALNYKDQYQDVGPILCVGCRTELQGEYHACVGGQWFKVDSGGHLEPASLPDSGTKER